MQNQSAKQKIRSAPKPIGQAILCVFLVFFMIFEAAFVSIVIVRSMPEKEPERPVQTSQDGVHNPTPQPSNPIFVNGVLPSGLMGTGTVLGAEISSGYAILIDAQTSEVLASKNQSVRFSPASMTKVMTLIVALEHLTAEDLERRVMATDALYTYVTSGAYKGTDNAKFDPEDEDSVRVIDLLYGIGMESYSDCVMMVVGEVCPASTYEESERQFVALMNQKAAALGLSDTQFDNVVGHESEGNYSTAADIARMTVYALQCDTIKAILSRNSKYEFFIDYVRDGVEKQYRYTYYSTLFNINPETSNRMKAYEKQYGEFKLEDGLGFGGGKTGTLGETGAYVYSLVSYVTKEGRTYVIVTGETTLGHGVMADVKTLAENYIP